MTFVRFHPPSARRSRGVLSCARSCLPCPCLRARSLTRALFSHHRRADDISGKYIPAADTWSAGNLALKADESKSGKKHGPSKDMTDIGTVGALTLSAGTAPPPRHPSPTFTPVDDRPLPECAKWSGDRSKSQSHIFSNNAFLTNTSSQKKCEKNNFIPSLPPFRNKSVNARVESIVERAVRD